MSSSIAVSTSSVGDLPWGRLWLARGALGKKHQDRRGSPPVLNRSTAWLRSAALLLEGVEIHAQDDCDEGAE
jgi:hypothetical protein